MVQYLWYNRDMSSGKQQIETAEQPISNFSTVCDIFSTTIDFLDAIFSLGAKIILELGKIFLIVLGLALFVVAIKSFIGSF